MQQQNGLVIKPPFSLRNDISALYPYRLPLASHLLLSAFGPALSAGNSVVLKPSEHASLSLLRFAELAHEAGLPESVLNVVTGLGYTVGHTLD